MVRSHLRTIALALLICSLTLPPAPTRAQSAGGGAQLPTGAPVLRTLAMGTVGAFLDYPTNGAASVGLAIQGLTAAGGSVQFTTSNDGGSAPYTGIGNINAGTGAGGSQTFTADTSTRFDVAARTNFRVTVLTAGSGSITVGTNVSTATAPSNSPIPPGNNLIGSAVAVTPNVTAAGTTITKCSVAATSATATCNTYVGTGTATSGSVVCPAATGLQSEEVRSSVALLGLSLVGNTLTTATDGTGTGTPDLVLPSANALYTLPVPQSNAVTAYNPSASAAFTTCIQRARQ